MIGTWQLRSIWPFESRWLRFFRHIRQPGDRIHFMCEARGVGMQVPLPPYVTDVNEQSIQISPGYAHLHWCFSRLHPADILTVDNFAAVAPCLLWSLILKRLQMP